MTIGSATRNAVRQRANYSCEYCGLREADVSGHLTVDHYQPRAKGGEDTLDNLVYCCIWCNQRKSDYWPTQEGDLHLWCPRHSAASEHFLLLDDGMLKALTETGAFTMRRLHLNRATLVAYRLRQRALAEQDRVLTYYHDLLAAQAQLIAQLAKQVEEQQALLAEQQIYLTLLSNLG